MRLCPLFWVLLALMTGSITMPTALAERPYRDNSGRQIAVVVPGLAVSDAVPKGFRPSARGVALPDTEGNQSQQKQTLTLISTPTGVRPQIKAAVERGALIAEGLEKLAEKRAADFSSWIAVLWKQMSDLPRITPASSTVADRMTSAPMPTETSNHMSREKQSD